MTVTYNFTKIVTACFLKFGSNFVGITQKLTTCNGHNKHLNIVAETLVGLCLSYIAHLRNIGGIKHISVDCSCMP